jgi:hypothetical protein
MFEASDVSPIISIDEIYSHISEYDIFKRYCPHFKEIDKPFLSEFYNDKNAACRIYQSKSNRLYYKDYGNGDNFGCFEYIMFKYSCSFKEAINIVANDFNLFRGIATSSTILLGKEKEIKVVKPRFKSSITIHTRNWDLIDYEYWGKYGIDFGLLESYDVFPVKYVYLHKQDKTIVFNHYKANPIYAYRFTNDGKYSYKIYKPLSPDKKYKWLFSGGVKDNIEGFDQLPLHGDILILNKSLKDVMCTHLCGYPSISLQGEANILEQELVNKLLKRFNKIIVLYDNDSQGLKSAKVISDKYGFKSIIIPLEYNSKDLSDLVVKIGLKEAKNVLNKLINYE